MSLLQDFRLALRLLKKSPGTTLVTVLALALGIGVNTSAFSTVSALVLHPLPYPQTSRIMTVWETIPKMRTQRDAVAPANFFDWQDRSRSFERIAAYRSWDVALTGAGDPERLRAFSVSPAFFPLLGMQPMMGRTFRSEETTPGHSQVVVISHSFWERRMGSAPDAVGKTISLGGLPHTVIGVMPEDFDYPLAAELWSPLSLTPEEQNDRAVHSLAVLARLKPDASVSKARAEMDAISRHLAQEHPDTNESREARVIPILELTNNVTDRFTLMLLCTAGFVLLLACANIGNLQLVRATSRTKEIAVRTALGAGRLQLARQLLIDSVLTAVAGGLLGLQLASWNLSLTPLMVPPEVFKWVAGLRNMRITGEVVLFTLALSLIAGLLCAAPAIFQMLHGRKSADLNHLLKEGGRSGTSGRARSRLRNALAIGEVALALVLLIGAGLMIATFNRALTLNTGFNPNNLLTLQVSLPLSEYRTKASMTEFSQRALDGVSAIAEVKAAAAVVGLGTAEGLYVEGRPEPRPGEPRPAIRAITENYFEALGLPILQGRAIGRMDGPDAENTVVVSNSIARHYWPDSNPIGQRMKLGNGRSPWLTVVGVSGDVKDWFDNEPQPAAYVSYAQSPAPGIGFYLRTTGDPMRIASAVREKIRAVDVNLPVFDVKTMDRSISEQTSGVRAAAVSMTTYAVIALLLAVTGIYAVISYSVAQRTHEIGIRMALGADRRTVLKMTLGQAARIAGIGLGIGVPLAALLTRVLSSVLYNVIAVDLTTLTLLTVLLGGSGVLAGYIPARRAARVDPMTALHHE
ncbi:MAG: ABC transporter permease [Bryobacteraceae bacterium]